VQPDPPLPGRGDHGLFVAAGWQGRDRADGPVLPGTLTVRDIARPVSLLVEQTTVSPESFTARGTTRVDRAEFGFVWKSGPLAYDRHDLGQQKMLVQDAYAGLGWVQKTANLVALPDYPEPAPRQRARARQAHRWRIAVVIAAAMLHRCCRSTGRAAPTAGQHSDRVRAELP
jgi:hypothetical protein